MIQTFKTFHHEILQNVKMYSYEVAMTCYVVEKFLEHIGFLLL